MDPRERWISLVNTIVLYLLTSLLSHANLSRSAVDMNLLLKFRENVDGKLTADRTIMRVGDETVMIYKFNLYSNRIGNNLGDYFETYLCSILAGFHFIAIKQMKTLQKAPAPTRTFLETFPEIVVHKSPTIGLDIANKHYDTYCSCAQYCWSKLASSWWRGDGFDHIEHIMSNALSSYVQSRSNGGSMLLAIDRNLFAWSNLASRPLFGSSNSYSHNDSNSNSNSNGDCKIISKTDLHEGTDDCFPSSRQEVEISAESKADTDDIDYASISSRQLPVDSNLEPEQPQMFPFLPDVAIQFRCSDIVRPHLRNHYGFLNFHAYSQIIPPETRLIYIFTQTSYEEDADICEHVLGGMLSFLEQVYPDTTIMVMRGGNVLDIMVQFAYAPITICSASTFCFWPTLVSSSFLSPSATASWWAALSTRHSFYKQFHRMDALSATAAAAAAPGGDVVSGGSTVDSADMAYKDDKGRDKSGYSSFSYTHQGYHPSSLLFLEGREVYVSASFHWITTPKLLYLSKNYTVEENIRMLVSRRRESFESIRLLRQQP